MPAESRLSGDRRGLAKSPDSRCGRHYADIVSQIGQALDKLDHCNDFPKLLEIAAGNVHRAAVVGRALFADWPASPSNLAGSGCCKKFAINCIVRLHRGVDLRAGPQKPAADRANIRPAIVYHYEPLMNELAKRRQCPED